MTDIDKFAAALTDGQSGALAAHVLLNELLCLLRKKGVLTPHEVAELVASTSVHLGESGNSVAKGGGRFIEQAIWPEHKVV